MGALLVVVADPVWQCLGAVGVGEVGLAVSPFPMHGLVESFDLPVRAGSVGADGDVADEVIGEECAERLVFGVRLGVVGHEAFGGDAVACEPREGPGGEGGDGRASFAVVELDVGEAGVVIGDGVGVAGAA